MAKITTIQKQPKTKIQIIQNKIQKHQNTTTNTKRTFIHKQIRSKILHIKKLQGYIKPTIIKIYKCVKNCTKAT